MKVWRLFQCIIVTRLLCLKFSIKQLIQHTARHHLVFIHFTLHYMANYVDIPTQCQWPWILNEMVTSNIWA